ncbi:ABC-type spermidine/putrescine transport system permease subunit I [Bradyrhizobium sp. USDA 4516]
MRKWELVGFLAPVSAVMTLGLIVPLVFIIYNSLGNAHLSLDAYIGLFHSSLFGRVVLTTVEMAVESTAIGLVLAYPVALHLSRVSDWWRPFFLIFVLLPFWTSILVKSYAFIVVLGDHGLVNNALASVGLPRLPLMFNRVGVLAGMTSVLIPFAVFPLLSNLIGQNADLRKAAAVMGASDFRIFWQITFPLSASGIVAAGVICFVISIGTFITPSLLGGRKDTMVANLIDFYTHESLDWATASAIAVLLFAISGTFMLLLGRLRRDSALI